MKKRLFFTMQIDEDFTRKLDWLAIRAFSEGKIKRPNRSNYLKAMVEFNYDLKNKKS